MPQCPHRPVPAEPSRQHRRRRARDEDHGTRRPAPGGAGALSRAARRSGWRPMPRTCSQRARLHATLPRRLPTAWRRSRCRRAPREWSPQVLDVRAAAARRRGARRRRWPSSSAARAPGSPTTSCSPASSSCTSRRSRRPARSTSRRRCRSSATSCVMARDATVPANAQRKARHGGGPRGPLRAPRGGRASRAVFHPASGSRLRERWRRLFSRVPDLEREEVNILRGLLNALLEEIVDRFARII